MEINLKSATQYYPVFIRNTEYPNGISNFNFKNRKQYRIVISNITFE